MDVNRYAFENQLPLILKAIADSRFVTFDFELSGIPGKQTGQARAPGRSEDGKQTLQERYEETKKAAERYQILQLGLTCVEEDLERGRSSSFGTHLLELMQYRRLRHQTIQFLLKPCDRQEAGS